MHNQELCTEEEAAKLAGVSSRTLHRFCESGYLTVTQEADGSRRYLAQQLCEIFGMHGSPELNLCADDSAQVELEAVLTASQGDTESQQLGPTSEAPAAESPAAVTNSNEAVEQDIGSSNSERQVERLELEIQRLNNLLSIQERILDSKDDEIADLRNQRAWLRERVEKFEEKSDRDQILLLSETQTIRSLLAYQESRKSALRQLLEWVGLAQSTQLPALVQSTEQKSKSAPSSRTIEVKRAANSD